MNLERDASKAPIHGVIKAPRDFDLLLFSVILMNSGESVFDPPKSGFVFAE